APARREGGGGRAGIGLMGVLGVVFWPVTATARGAYSLARPEIDRVLDRVLDGPLTEQVARELMEHRVPERLVVSMNAEGELEKLVRQALESQLLVELTDAILRSEEMQLALDHIAKSP